MELVDLESIAKKEKIHIINYKMKKLKSKIVDFDNPVIFVDYSKVKNYTEEKCLLAEELGHYYYEAYYSIYSSKATIDRQEYKSLKWRSLSCVSLKSILDCFYKRYMLFIGYCRRITSRAQYG